MAFDNNKTAAHMFGARVAAGLCEKQANVGHVVRIGGKVIPWLTQAVARTGRAAATAGKARGAASGAAHSLLPALGSNAHRAITGVVDGVFKNNPAAKFVANHTRQGFKGLYDAVRGAKNTSDDALAKLIGPRFRELQVNSTAAQRLNAGTMNVVRPKPVGFRDLGADEWANLSKSFDDYDAKARAAGLL